MCKLNWITNIRSAVLLLSLIASPFAIAHEAHMQHQEAALAVSVAFDAAGTLWRASVQEGFVVVDRSRDLGKTFSAPVKVNQTAQKIGAAGEARPKIALSPQGDIYVTWTEALKKPFSGYVWFARSVDGGRNFEKPMIVHQDKAEITHRFDALQVAPNGEVTVLWVDKRDLESAKKAGKKYDGAAIYYAVSKDAGKSFQSEQKLADGSCECCRIATAVNPQNRVVTLFRYVFEGSERDHMIAEIPHAANQTPILKRASYGKWQVDGCPHHGAAIAAGGEGKNWWGYHFAYFDGNEKKPGLYYSRVDGEAWAFFPPKKFGNHQKQAGHPALVSVGEKVWLVWREVEGDVSQIYGRYSENDGKDWTDAKLLLSAEDKVDYPQLLKQGEKIWLVWNTQVKGLQMLALNGS